MVVVRRQIDSSTEERILTGLIVSTAYAKQAVPLLRLEHFQADHCRTVAGWCLRYFRRYKQVPGRHIQDLYEQRKKKLSEEMVGLLENFLSRLSAEYERSEVLNAEYLLDQTIQYVKERSLTLLKEQIEVLLADGKTDEAERTTLEYRQIERRSLPIVDLFDPETVRQILSGEEDSGGVLFSLPGAVGEMIGPLKRNTLVGVMGAAGRGKSFLVQEMAMSAALNGYNVLYASMEMGEKSLGSRFFRRLSGCAKIGGVLVFPVFDCQANQSDSCSLPDRRNGAKLVGFAAIHSFRNNPRYNACSACRGRPRGEFDPTLWWYEQKVKKLDNAEVQRFLRGSEIHFGGLKGRVKVLWQARLTLNEIENYMNCLEDSEGFVADVLVVDYPAIMAHEYRMESRWERLDDIWMRMKALAGVKHCLVLAPSQSTRRGAQKRSLAQTDVAEDWGVMAHVDSMITLNQSEMEKRSLGLRIGVVKKREDDYDVGRECLVLQQLDTCQMILDSEWLGFNSTWARRIRGQEGGEGG